MTGTRIVCARTKCFIVSIPSTVCLRILLPALCLTTNLLSHIGIADRVKNFAVLYVCDLDQVPDFKQMYELYDTVTLMFFFRNKHMMCDFGTGNNNKLNWVLEDKQELIDIIETIYRGAKQGRGLVVSPKDYSTRYRY